MKVYFLTREPDVCQLIGDKLTLQSFEVRIFPLVTELFETIFDKENIPDILFLDFLFFQNGTYDFYSILEKYNKVFPIVYYNHPFPIPQKRKIFWIFNLKKTELFQDLSYIEPLLNYMQIILQDPEIFPYVSAIQQPKPFRSRNLRYIEPLKKDEIEFYLKRYDNVITDFLKNTIPKTLPVNKQQEYELSSEEISFANNFRSRNKLSHKIFVLFKCLYSNLNSHVSTIELQKALSYGSKQESQNGIRLAVFRLRAVLKEDVSVKFEILSYDNGYSLVDLK